jgi:hypothetical protein
MVRSRSYPANRLRPFIVRPRERGHPHHFLRPFPPVFVVAGQRCREIGGAGALPSKAAVLRLVEVTLAGLHAAR